MQSTIFIRALGEGVQVDFSERADRLALPDHHVGSVFHGALGALGLSITETNEGMVPRLRISGSVIETIKNAPVLAAQAPDIAAQSSALFCGDRVKQSADCKETLQKIGETIGRMPDCVSLSVLVGAVASPIAQQLNPEGVVTAFEQTPSWLTGARPAIAVAA